MKSVPFYQNAQDNNHCFQAALKMVLGYFNPEKEYTWKDLNIITGKVADHWTWVLTTLLWLADTDFDIRYMTIFDYEEFSRDGEIYLRNHFKKEVADAQIAHSNIQYEEQQAKKVSQLMSYDKKNPTIADIKNVLDQGFICICNVNAYQLYEMKGYSGHSVVVYDYTEKGFMLHDPGLPPKESVEIIYEIFSKAWAYPNDYAKSILAIRG